VGARLAVEAQRHEIEEGVLLEAAPGMARRRREKYGPPQAGKNVKIGVGKPVSQWKSDAKRSNL